MNSSGEVLGNLDTCHYPDEGQILTTTDAPASPLVGACEREIEEPKILRWIMNALKFILMLASRGPCSESLRITPDLLGLIVGCIVVSCYIGRLDLSKG